MTDEEEGRTHFNFDFGGITLELSGDRRFVEKLYRRVMKDVEYVRAGHHEVAKHTEEEAPTLQNAVWVHRCSEMMRKIYMTTQAEVGQSILAGCITPDLMGVVYVDKGVMDRVFPELEKGQTLWAEFTPAGRERIAEVTAPVRKTLVLPGNSE
ncbi:MAG: hypothetical protein ACNA8W_00875 [Bradymonadaceae bacterium]